MSRASWTIYKALEKMFEACEIIHDNGCEKCPISSECMRDKPMRDVIEGLPEDAIDAFIKLSEELTSYRMEEC